MYKNKTVKWSSVCALLAAAMIAMSGCGGAEDMDKGDEALQTSSVDAGAVSLDSEDAALSAAYDVVRVVDGDTLVLDMDGTQEKIRLIGVDTPESVHPNAAKNVAYGKIASQYSKELLEGKAVQLEYDVQERDKYGRVLAYVYLDGQMYNKLLLAEGHAKAATFPPNVKYVDEFTKLEEQAREEQKGLWGYEEDPADAGAAGGAAEQPEQTGITGAAQDKEAAAGDQPAVDANEAEAAYIGNKNSKIFHRSTCNSVRAMKETNKVSFSTAEEAAAAGYESCGNCRP